MSLSKKYVYVHNCNLSKTEDNFRNALGRVWVESRNSGLQYGYDINPMPFTMEFGPIMEWSREYFNATEVPVKTQVVSVNPNYDIFPLIEDQCCGWEKYFDKFLATQFSRGNPSLILSEVISLRIKNYRDMLEKGTLGVWVPYDPLFGMDNRCSSQAEAGYNAKLFRDMWFQIMAPFSQAEDGVIDGKEKALASDVSFNYNFYLEEYERKIVTQSLPEIRIPNLYLTVYYPGDVPYITYLRNNAECRYQEFTKLVLQDGYQDLLVPIKQLPFIQDKNIYSTSFPMDATISFGTDRSTFVADALEDSKMEAVMLRRVSEGEIELNSHGQAAFTDSTVNNYSPPGEKVLDFKFAKRFYSTIDIERSIPSGPYDRKIPTFDLYTWLMGLPDVPPSSTPLPKDHVFLGNQNDSTDMALKSGLYQTDFSFLANYLILSGKINEISKVHLRSYQQMMQGATPHSETILYRISKYSTEALRQANIPIPESVVSLDPALLGNDMRQMDLGVSIGDVKDLNTPGNLPAISENLESVLDSINNNGNVQPIQNVYIPNSNTVDIVEYVDSQVKYNRGYTYVVTAYQLSVGTEYFYSQHSKTPEAELCPDREGLVYKAGVFRARDMKTILGILDDGALSESDKYNQIVEEVKKLDSGFDSSGTHIGIAAKRTLIEPTGGVTGTIGDEPGSIT
jgi:hypothetical protein